MADRIRQVGYSGTRHPEIFKEMQEEFSPIEVGDPNDTDVEPQQVEEADDSSFVVERFREDVPEQEDDFELGLRERAWKTEEIDMSDNVGMEFAEGTSTLTEKVNQIERVNERLEKRGVNRRYVLGVTDAPDSAHVYEDRVGKYYYEIEEKLRPSDVTSVIEEESWFNLSQKGRVLATVLLLSKRYPWVFDDAKSETAADSLLERALITEVDELENEDVFSLEKVQEVKEFLLNR